MAAVVKWSNWCKLLLAIFLFVSLSFAPGVITTDTSTAITFLDVSASDGVVSAKLTALTVEGGVKHDESILLEAFREAQKGNQVEAETILESAGLGHFEDYLGQVQSETLPIEGAELNFYYLNKVDEDGKFVYVREEVSGCAPLKEEEGSPGVFHCPLPPIYAETCTEVFVTFGDPVYGTQLGDTTYPFIEESVRVCDEETNALAVMRTSITEVLTQGMGNSFCFASILVGGMLIASMFFAGRSPLSLLDITTPLLPKAKSISYGGLRMGTGFGRMMKEMGEMGGAGGGIIASSSKATSARLLRYLRSKKGYNQRLINIIMGSGANELLKMMALRALIAGKNERYLRKILALSGKNVLDPENQKKYGKLISELENLDDAEKLNRYNSIGLKRGESLHEAVIGLSKMSMYNAMQQKAFADSTGEIPAWFKTPLGKTLGRLPFIGTHIMGGTASLFFGGRHLGRFYNNVARGAVRAVGDMATPKGDKKFSERIQMAVNDARRKKQKPGMFAGWVALKDNERQIVKIFDNFEYGSALYKRLMGESKKDILNWLVGTIITHYGGKFALSREEVMRIGLENPEQLMLKKLNSGKFAKMEAELRNILSDTGLDDVQKARRLMKLMNSQGIVFDEMGAKNALNILIGIDRGKPLSTAGEGIVDPENPHAIDSHRLMRLQMYLQEQFKVDQFVDLKTEYMDKGKFFFAVGRTSLASKDADFNFAVFFRKKYREALELPTKAGEKPLTIGDIANYAFLRVVNERWGIMDPNTPGIDAEMKLVMQNAKNWLKSLVNPFASKDTIDSASIASMLSSLTAPSGRDKADEEGGMGLMGFGAEYGPKPGAWRLNMKAHWKLHGGAMGGIKMAAENQADGETNLAHNIPLAVQRAIDKGATYNEAVKKYRRETVESYLFKRLKGIIEQDNPNTYFTSQVEFDRFRQIWASYKAFIAREKLKEGKSGDERDVTDAEVRELIKRKMGVEEVSRGTWIRLREGSFAPFIEKHTYKTAQSDRIVNAKRFIKRGGYWEEFAPENFLKHHKEFKDFLAKDSPIRKILGTPDYNLETEIRGVPREDLQEYSKFMGKFRGKVPTQPELEAMMQQLSEKANAGLKKGNLKLADSYAAMAGKILYENSEAIKKISKDPQEITKVFSEMFGDKLKGKVRLESLLRDYEGAVTVADRKSAAEKLKEWAKDNDAAGEERQVKVALLFNKYGEQRGDWYDLNNYTDVVRIRPAASTVPRDPSDLEAQPYEKVGGVKGFIKNVWNMGRQTWDPILNKANLGLEQFMLSTFGKQMKSEYEGSLTSEYFRETGAKFAAKLAAGDFGDMHDSRYASDPAIRQYNSLMDSFTRYHAIWDETITRDPRGNSSAIGSAFIYSGFFHHGPAMAFGPAPYRRWTHAGYQTPWTTWSGIKKNVRERLWGLQYTPAIFNWAVGTPFGVAYRTYITSRWGFMTKHDRKYKEDKAYSETVEKERKEYYQRAELNYEQQRKQYQEQFENTMSQYKSEGKSAEAARELASMDLAGQKPTPPSFELERDILKPYSETQPRMAEAHASMLNWFYASFDPTATNWKRFAAAAFSSPLLPVAQFIPSRWVQSKVLGNGSALLNREDSNPYYVSPQGMRSLMMKATGPMVKRQYGGTEMVTGVVRSHEDTWAYQSGVYAIWGNTNPGASYVDFSNSIHMDPRAANYLRYESRFRPFMEYDDYVDRQSKLGLVKRDIDPFQLMATRNAELRHYKFPQNTLFRFLNPATLAWYKGGAALGRVANVAGSVRDFFRGTSTQPVNGRLGQMKVGAGRLALRAGEAIDNYAYKKFDLRHTKSVRYCQSCQGPVAEGGTCPACARNVRCPYCSSSVNPSHNHNCSHGISRNLHNEQLSGAYADGQFERSLMSSSTARNRMFDHTFKSRTRDTWGRET